MIASQAQKTCVHARGPPSGGGPGFVIERVVKWEATRPIAADAADFVLERGGPWAPGEHVVLGVG